MNCRATGTRKAWVMRSRSMISTRAVGSSSRTMTLVAPTASPASAQPPPPMWNRGMATRFTESRSKPMRSGYRSSPAARLRLGQLHALGPAGRARRVELVGDVLLGLRRHRVVGRVGVAPFRVARERRARATDDDDRRAGQVADDLLDDGHELLAHREHLGLGVGDDHRDLRRGQAEVHRRRHRVELGRAVEELELLGAVLVEVRDVVALSHPRRLQRLRDPARPLVELPVGELLVTPAQGRVIGLLLGPVSDEVSGGHQLGAPWRACDLPSQQPAHSCTGTPGVLGRARGRRDVDRPRSARS